MTLPVRRALLILLTGTLGCSSDLLLPDPTAVGGTIDLIKVDGDAQRGPVGGTLAPLKVKVLTEQQEPVVGLEVAFEITDPAAGAVSPPNAVTNSAGEAVAHWTLGTVPGSYTVVARLADSVLADSIVPEEFHAAAEPAEPDTLSAPHPVDQPGRREQAVDPAPEVRVVDRFGNPVPNVPVAWQVTAGEGRVDSPITTTDADGKAKVGWTLGNRLGVHKLTASIEQATGSPVTFTAWVYF
jgi:hypothetical protein